MKKSTLLLLLCALGFISNLKAQTPHTLRIRIIDEKNQAIQGAVGQLVRLPDSSFVKANASDAQGELEFDNIHEGKYFIRFSLVGYAKSTYPAFDMPAQDFRLPEYILKPSSTQLKDVQVTARKPMIEIKADRTVFNVENSVNATGSTALELLRKSPGISVDQNDNITMKGKTGVKIYIDGKLSLLDAASLAAYLKSLNSSDIEAIEMISNPGARFDASGNAGVINIKLRKNRNFGTNGNLDATLTQGYTPKGNLSLNLNNRNAKFNTYGNFSYHRGIWHGGQNFTRTQNDTVYDMKSDNQSDNQDINLKAGIDWFKNSKNTFGLMVNGSFSDGTWSSAGLTQISTPNAPVFRSLMATNAIPGNRQNINTNFNYHYADTNGRDINVDLDYGSFRSDNRSFQPNNYRLADGSPLFSIINKNHTPIQIDLFTAKADFEIPVWKGKFNFGIKSALVKTQNTFDFWNVIQDVEVYQAARSNRFAYTENVNAAYVQFNRSFGKKISLQAGLRMENTRSEGVLTRADKQQQNDETVTRDYTNLFPSAVLSYVVNKNNNLSLSYSRRIDRPSYQDLNPFEFKLDELTYQKGNAFLKPQYTDNIELTHTFMGFLNSTLGYSNVFDYSTMITDTVRNATYIQQRNLANQQILSLSLGAGFPVKSWWNVYTNLWANHQDFRGSFGMSSINLQIVSYGGYMQHTFNLGKNFNLELSGWYNGPSVWGGTFRTKSQGAIDIGIQKQLFNKKGSLKLAITDPFFTAPWRAVSEFAGANINGNGYWESRTFRATFSYRFGQSGVAASRNRKSGLDAEKNRIK